MTAFLTAYATDIAFWALLTVGLLWAASLWLEGE